MMRSWRPVGSHFDDLYSVGYALIDDAKTRHRVVKLYKGSHGSPDPHPVVAGYGEFFAAQRRGVLGYACDRVRPNAPDYRIADLAEFDRVACPRVPTSAGSTYCWPPPDAEPGRLPTPTWRPGATTSVPTAGVPAATTRSPRRSRRPGIDEDVIVRTDVATLVEVQRGRLRLQDATTRGTFVLDGNPVLVRALPSWGGITPQLAAPAVVRR